MIELEQMQSLIKREDLQEEVDLNEKKVQPDCEVDTQCNYNSDVHALSFEIEDQHKCIRTQCQWYLPTQTPRNKFIQPRQLNIVDGL